MFLIPLALPISLFSQNIEFQILTIQQGLSHNTVYNIDQDADGFIWIATGEGLDRYDSYAIKKYHNSSIGKNISQITSLLINDQDFFIGTNKGLYTYSVKQDTFQIHENSGKMMGHINNIYHSSDGLNFICSKQGLFSIDRDSKIYPILTNVNARSICNFKANVYFLALEDKILLINELGETIKGFKYPERLNSPSLSGYYLKPTLFQDSEGMVWLGTVKGLFIFDINTNDFKQVTFTNESNQLEGNVIRSITEDQNKKIWIGTEDGLFIYDKKTKKSFHYGQSFYNTSNNLSDKSIHELFVSKENILWIGTYFGGLNFSKLNSNGFHKLIPDEFNNSLSGKAISQMIQVKNNDIWIATEDGGVSIFDKKNNSFRHLKQQSENKNSISSNNIHSLLEDDRGNVWIGTFLGGLNKYNQNSGNITVYKNKQKDTTTISNDHIYSLLQLNTDTLLIGTQYGLNYYNYKTNTFSIYKPEIFDNKFVYDMIKTKNNDIWICTSHSGIYRIKNKTQSIDHYEIKDINPELIDNEVIGAFEDKKGDIWFCSYSGGLIKWIEDKNEFENITKENGLPNNSVYGILEHQEKGYFISTNAGLSFYNPENFTFKTYTISDGLTTNQFNYKSYLNDKDGWMYFGSVNGITYFHPDSINIDKSKTEIHLTGLKLFNKEVNIGENSPLKNNINEIDTLILKYNENAITLEFVQIDYNSKANYSFYLEGYEKEWNDVGKTLAATYTNLPPGDYIFNVKSNNTNTDLINSSDHKKLHIIISPPIWKTNWAYAIYFLFIILCFYAYYRLIKFIQDKNLAIELEKVENAKLSEINTHKLNFFTFISHEFKTPLTIIIASMEKLFQNSLSITDSDNLISIKKNSKKLHHLVQQLMEFRKVETDHAKIKLDEGDIITFLKDTFDAFDPLFKYKSIKTQFESNVIKQVCYFDSEKLDSIITNILSNAVKHTDNYGEITMNIIFTNISTTTKDQKMNLKIQISDNGNGISKKEQENLFLPFYEYKNSSKSGSGIGLVLVKSLVNFLNGSFSIDSNKKKGTICTIELPIHLQIEKNKNTIKINGNKKADIPYDLVMENTSSSETINIFRNSEYTILIVEDNRELMTFLNKHFSTNYKILMARDGQDALLKIDKIVPDIIISDIRMPNMDGIRFCRIIKESKKTSHIPFILLTGESNEQNKFDGLEFGANAFLSKPFNLTELDLMVRNLLESNLKIQHHINKVRKNETAEIPNNNQKRDFLIKITDIIENNFDDPDFSIEKLANIAGISRSLLHIKVKDITGSSASTLIKNIRMQKAVILLEEGYSISEVAYQIGYEPSYFSRVFKKFYKASPSSYIKNN